MEEEEDEGHPLLDHQYCRQDNKTFQGIDYSTEERTPLFYSHKKCKIKDYGTGMCACRLDKEQKENSNQEIEKNIEKSISKL